MLTLKRTIHIGAFMILSCAVRDHALAAPNYETMDCRHLFVEDVSLSDRIAIIKQKQATAMSNGTDTADNGFFVKFDSVPGIGIMHGITLSPEGKPLGDEVSDAEIRELTNELTAVKRQQNRKVCPTMTAPLEIQTRLKDDQIRVAP